MNATINIKSRAASKVPGDTLRETTATVWSLDGREWPTGTQFRPLSNEYSNIIRRTVAVVSIKGERVCF